MGVRYALLPKNKNLSYYLGKEITHRFDARTVLWAKEGLVLGLILEAPEQLVAVDSED